MGNSPVTINPIYIEITLNTNNLIDRKVLKRLRELGDKSENITSIYNRKTMESVILNHFAKEVVRYELEKEEKAVENSTSVYFISEMLKLNNTINFFKVLVDNNKTYSRVVSKDGATYLELENKWIAVSLDFYKFAKDKKELEEFNEDMSLYLKLDYPSFYKQTHFGITIDKFISTYDPFTALVESKLDRRVSKLTEALYDTLKEYEKKYEFNVISILTEWD